MWSGGSFLGGIHAAACGGIWQVLVHGFAGFRSGEDGISCQPSLPGHWERLSFQLMVRGNLLDMQLTSKHITIRAAEEKEGLVNVRVGAEARTLGAGDSAKLSC